MGMEATPTSLTSRSLKAPSPSEMPEAARSTWMNQVPGLVGIDVQESYRWQNGTNRLAPGAYQNVSALNSLDLEKV